MKVDRKSKVNFLRYIRKNLAFDQVFAFKRKINIRYRG